MNTTCRQCQKPFEITASDAAFYEKIQVPYPTLCPSCRQQRRLAFRNERYLFKRQCDLCRKDMISFFDAAVPFPVYCTECWWSDKWDPLKYGRDFDPEKPFFDQFGELMMKVPKMGILQLANENSAYNAFVAYCKNTYMSPGSYYLEDCYYTRKSQYCRDCVNGNFLDHCELVANSGNCKNCYGSHNLVNCRGCNDCGYMADSQGCQNCFMCSGIASKKFCYRNKQLPEQEYRRIVEEQMKRDPDDLLKEFMEFNRTIPKKALNNINCENASGDYLQNCKNADECYDCFDVQDSKYITESVAVKDSMDLSMHDKDIELCYELSSGGESNMNLRFSFCTVASTNSDYLYSCMYLSESFGCDSMHLKLKHCILNKQYSPEEYTALKQRIIEHMKRTGEYGEFFPIRLSLYPYNFTVAQDYYPLTRDEALRKKYPWKEQEASRYLPATYTGSLRIEEIPENITKETLACKFCGRNYRIISQELKLHQRMKLPLSGLCADCRQLELNGVKNPRCLYEKACMKCGKVMQTTYVPGRKERAPAQSRQGGETVYCEQCYLNAVY